MGDYGGYPPPPAGGQSMQSMQQPGADRRQKGLGLAAKDPLLKAGESKKLSNKIKTESSRPPRSQRVFQLTALSVAPFCTYVLILFLTTYMFYQNPLAILLTFTIVAGLCVTQYLLVDNCVRKKAPRWKAKIGAFSAVAAFVGLLVGLGIHYKWMLFNAKYTHMMRYTNVAPAQPALQFEDAGALHFTSGTTVDRTRAVGYRHIRTSQTLCVAPIVSSQMSTTDEIVFFAVGVNCCGWRASFHCDDAGSSARGGLLMLSPDQLVSPAMEWMVDEQFDFKGFEDAIELQKSVFAVTVAKHHRMMRWVEDSDAEIDNYRKRALEAALISCAVYWVVVGIIIGWHLHTEDVAAKKRADELIQGASVDGMGI